MSILQAEGRTDFSYAEELLSLCHGGSVQRVSPNKRIFQESKTDIELIVSVFPNPVKGMTTIKSTIENAEFTLYDGLGRIIQQEYFNYDTDMDLSIAPAGIYTLKIKNINFNQYKIEKLIVK
jgi:hypothetical protein